MRDARTQDCRSVWAWRNNEATREASFRTEPIPYEDHERWYREHLGRPETRIYIVLDAGGREVGYVRFSIEGEAAEVIVSIDPKERGKGYGSSSVHKAAEELLSRGSVREVVARIKAWNTASIRTFVKAGFVHRGQRQVSGVEALEMVYQP